MPGSDDVRTASTGVKLTYDDFLHFPDDGKRHELIDGEHYVTPSPSMKHQAVSGNLHFLIRNWLEQHPVGRVFYAPFDVVFTLFDVVEPDLMFMSNERAAAILTDKHVTGAPEIVVEIASRGTRKRDETIKRRLYERSGVLEYWVVDPELDVVRVYRREPQKVRPPGRAVARIRKRFDHADPRGTGDAARAHLRDVGRTAAYSASLVTAPRG